MEYEEIKEKVIEWLKNNNVFIKFKYNLFTQRPDYYPFTKEELDAQLIAKSFKWSDTIEGVRFWGDIDEKYREFYMNLKTNKMEESIKIEVPEGYEIDRENSTFEEIKFKKKEECWRAKEHSCAFIDPNDLINGFFIEKNSEIKEVKNITHTISNRNVFATKKQAKSALAMAQISQIMANDSRFGGSISDKEWQNSNIIKYAITRNDKDIATTNFWHTWTFLAFHTPEQRHLFIKENEDLVKDYLMID